MGNGKDGEKFIEGDAAYKLLMNSPLLVNYRVVALPDFVLALECETSDPRQKAVPPQKMTLILPPVLIPHLLTSLQNARSLQSEIAEGRRRK